jgi:peptidyl-prolyl cis-trans isomerase B (cyclophilin B)
LGATLEDFAAMKTSSLICAFSLIASFALVSCGNAQPTNNPVASQVANTNSTDEVAVINTTEGTMVIAFWPDVAPNTVANFKKLARSGFYDGTCFHRVIKNFMIQGGDPLTKDPDKEAMWGTGDPGYKIKAEFNDRSHTRGVISMARSQDPDSAGSQFFICHGNPTFLDHQYTAFGKLIKGDDVLEKIATTPTHPQDRPDKRMGVISIKIAPADSVK